jgi:predicted SAM-dependent methyltransferase
MAASLERHLSLAGPRIADALAAGDHEFEVPLAKQFFYWLEREVGHRLFRRPPPASTAPRLLNLGSGPILYAGWINADDYAFKRALRERRFRPEWRLDIARSWQCDNDYWDGIFTQHVLEHVRYSAAIATLRECYRTLKPGAWIRISVPDLRKYVDFYVGRLKHEHFSPFQPRALAISFLTQMHMHRSTWDADLLCAVLREVGFVDATEVAFGQGHDARLIKDQDVKAAESLYVEARKPGP